MNNKMFYVAVFSRQAEDYIIVGAYSEKAKADDHLATLKAKENTSGSVLEWSWTEFETFATKSRIGKLADALEKLGIKS